MRILDWNIEEMTGYKPITTFYTDFSIADHFGELAIKDTYERGLETATAMGYKELTEFVMVLNWKIWEHYETNEKYGKLYNDLWATASKYAMDTLKGEELHYYFITVD